MFTAEPGILLEGFYKKLIPLNLGTNTGLSQRGAWLGDGNSTIHPEDLQKVMDEWWELLASLQSVESKNLVLRMVQLCRE
jgi:hypothetical protein